MPPSAATSPAAPTAAPRWRSCLVRVLFAFVSLVGLLVAIVLGWGAMWCCSFDPQRYPKEYALRRAEAEQQEGIAGVALLVSLGAGVAAVWPRRRQAAT